MNVLKRLEARWLKMLEERYCRNEMKIKVSIAEVVHLGGIEQKDYNFGNLWESETDRMIKDAFRFLESSMVSAASGWQDNNFRCRIDSKKMFGNVTSRSLHSSHSIDLPWTSNETQAKTRSLLDFGFVRYEQRPSLENVQPDRIAYHYGLASLHQSFAWGFTENRESYLPCGGNTYELFESELHFIGLGETDKESLSLVYVVSECEDKGESIDFYLVLLRVSGRYSKKCLKKSACWLYDNLQRASIKIYHEFIEIELNFEPFALKSNTMLQHKLNIVADATQHFGTQVTYPSRSELHQNERHQFYHQDYQSAA